MSTATSTAVEKTFFKYGNMRYFRTNANAIVLGTYGRKATPLTASNYLQPHDVVLRKNLVGRVRFEDRIKVDWDEVSSSEFAGDATVRYFTAKAEGAVSTSLDKARKARLELVQLGILEGDLIKMLNRDAHAARNYLADEGKDGRICSRVLIVVEGQVAESFERAGSQSGSISALVSGAAIKVTGQHKGSGSGNVSVVLAPKSTFAYGLHKVKDWSKGKERVEDMEDDQQGLN